MRISDWSSDVCSSDLTLAGGSQTRLGALTDQVTLELREGAEDVENQHASRRGGVDILSERAEADASRRQLTDLLDKVAHRAAEPIELPHHQRVAGAQIGQRLGKTGPVGPSTRSLIVENTIASCPLQSVMLERELLVGGGDPRIADQAQSARSCDFGHLGEHVGNGLVRSEG